jgi:hypothetical protein
VIQIFIILLGNSDKQILHTRILTRKAFSFTANNQNIPMKLHSHDMKPTYECSMRIGGMLECQQGKTANRFWAWTNLCKRTKVTPRAWGNTTADSHRWKDMKQLHSCCSFFKFGRTRSNFIATAVAAHRNKDASLTQPLDI